LPTHAGFPLYLTEIGLSGDLRLYALSKRNYVETPMDAGTRSN